MNTIDKRRCCSCYTTKDRWNFIRKNKIHMSCNDCSVKHHNQYLKRIPITEDKEEEKRLYSKEYYERNRNKMLEKSKERNSQDFVCECGAVVRYGSKSIHMRTEKHKNAMNYYSQVNKVLEQNGKLYLDMNAVD